MQLQLSCAAPRPNQPCSAPKPLSVHLAKPEELRICVNADRRSAPDCNCHKAERATWDLQKDFGCQREREIFPLIVLVDLNLLTIFVNYVLLLQQP